MGLLLSNKRTSGRRSERWNSKSLKIAEVESSNPAGHQTNKQGSKIKQDGLGKCNSGRPGGRPAGSGMDSPTTPAQRILLEIHSSTKLFQMEQPCQMQSLLLSYQLLHYNNVNPWAGLSD